MIEAFFLAISPSYLMYMTIGVLLGLVVGTLPGLTATMGTALLVPFTFALPTGEGIAMLGGLYVCAMFSDAIPACFVNTPGTPAAMATGFDGHPMVQQGRGQEAIVAACFSSALGTMFGAACYLLLAWPMISPIEITSSQRASVISIDYSIDIKHRYNVNFKMIFQIFGKFFFFST